MPGALTAGSWQAARANPTEWYVVDDPATTTRFFVIQGSDTLDHWRVNLTFDPVAFEDASLGVKVCCMAVTAFVSAQAKLLELCFSRLRSCCHQLRASALA